MSHHKGNAQMVHDDEECSVTYCGRAPSEVEDSPLQPGVQSIQFKPDEMGVAIIIPRAYSVIFRGDENDQQQLTQYSRRDLAIARALLMDAITAVNRADANYMPQPGTPPAPYPVASPWS